ncbi:MAG: bifunctional hydroxymethylpyrimidine kinase/phosphomethylpyrimidine kinase, partial [Acidimicrobiales bacterium]
AGSDSGGGAGIQADLRTFAAHGVWGTCAITAITAQNTRQVLDQMVLPPSLVRSQLNAVLADFPVGAAKTGMLGSAEVIAEVAAAMQESGIPLVVDPVLASSQGVPLLQPGGLEALVVQLLPLAALATPNLPEAQALLGRPIRTRSEMPSAAEDLAALGPRAVLLKGGHLDAPESPDLLWSDGGFVWLEGHRVEGPGLHGSGCVLSASICAHLARGEGLAQACAQAKRYVTELMTNRADPGGRAPPGAPLSGLP